MRIKHITLRNKIKAKKYLQKNKWRIRIFVFVIIGISVFNEYLILSKIRLLIKLYQKILNFCLILLAIYS
jgi:hypothetical protein